MGSVHEQFFGFTYFGVMDRVGVSGYRRYMAQVLQAGGVRVDNWRYTFRVSLRAWPTV